jgi:hypothetical protein
MKRFYYRLLDTFGGRSVTAETEEEAHAALRALLEVVNAEMREHHIRVGAGTEPAMESILDYRLDSCAEIVSESKEAMGEGKPT